MLPQKTQVFILSSLFLCRTVWDQSMKLIHINTDVWLHMVQVYPLFVTTGVVVRLYAMQLVRAITTNLEVRVTNEKHTAGVLENFDEGRCYSQHGACRLCSPPGSWRREEAAAVDQRVAS
jgi:hypothetical protein